MTTTLAKLTVEEMEENSIHWERYELYRGEPVEMTYTKPTHGKVLGKLFFAVLNWIQNKGFGEVYGGESGIKFNPNARYCFDLGWSDVPLAGDEIPTRALPLMVEIVSESNDVDKFLMKIEDYIKYGAKQVWVVYPRTKIIQVYYPDMSAKIFHDNDTLVPGEWMPSFELKLSEIF